MVADIGSPSAYPFALAGGRAAPCAAPRGVRYVDRFAIRQRIEEAFEPRRKRQQRVDGLAVRRCRVKSQNTCGRLQPQAFRPLIGIGRQGALIRVAQMRGELCKAAICVGSAL